MVCCKWWDYKLDLVQQKHISVVDERTLHDNELSLWMNIVDGVWWTRVSFQNQSVAVGLAQVKLEIDGIGDSTAQVWLMMSRLHYNLHWQDWVFTGSAAMGIPTIYTRSQKCIFLYRLQPLERYNQSWYNGAMVGLGRVQSLLLVQINFKHGSCSGVGFKVCLQFK